MHVTRLNRRCFLVTAIVAPLTQAPAFASPDSADAAIKTFTRGHPARDGKVSIDIASLVENGNTVPITVRVESPMTDADHVKRIAIFSEQNPLPDVATFHLTPANGRAQVATRIRLASSQRVVAVAEMSDGGFWQARVNVIVTLAACIEGAA